MSGSLLDDGLLLKSMCVFKLCLECFHRGFLFCCLRRTPLGNVENSLESVDSYLGKRVQESRLSVTLLGKRSYGPLICSSRRGKLKLGNL